jgi:hypothetical protein
MLASQPSLPQPRRQLMQRRTTPLNCEGLWAQTPIWVPHITTQLPYTHAAQHKERTTQSISPPFKSQHPRSTTTAPQQSPYSTEYLPREQHCMTHRTNFATTCRNMCCFIVSVQQPRQRELASINPGLLQHASNNGNRTIAANAVLQTSCTPATPCLPLQYVVGHPGEQLPAPPIQQVCWFLAMPVRQLAVCKMCRIVCRGQHVAKHHCINCSETQSVVPCLAVVACRVKCHSTAWLCQRVCMHGAHDNRNAACKEGHKKLTAAA